MNTNSNTYTVIYSIILVVVVAAVLAFVAKFLQPMQDANVKKDTISQILTAAGVEFTEENTLDTYKEEILCALVVSEEKTDSLSIEECKVYTNSDLKKQISAEKKTLPAYIFKNGTTVIPCYGAGLWGPIWGYIGLDTDLETIKGVSFGHKGETPGLGAKISDDPEFAKLFLGKKIGKEAEKHFEVSKPATKQLGDEQHVDAISGATITSQALGNTLNVWFGFYQKYISTIKAYIGQDNAEATSNCSETLETAEASDVVESENNVEPNKNEEK